MIEQLRNTKLLIGGSLVIAGLLVMDGYQTYQSISAKTEQQVRITVQLNRWKAAMRSMQPTIADWGKNIQSADQVKDLLSVYRALNLESAGLASSPDVLLLSKIERLTFEGSDLHATIVWATSAGKPGVMVTAPSYSQLIEGINRLATRRDIKLGSVIIGSEDEHSVPQAVLLGLGVILRDNK